MMNIWVVGIFDLFCVSDINTFNKIKQKYPNSCIKVGIFDDNDLKNKNIPVVITGQYRKMNIEHFKIIEEVIYPIPCIFTQDFIKLNGIDLVINYQMNNKNDIEMFSQIENHYEFFEKQEGTDNLEIISRVLSHLDEFIYRNLQRGVNRNELNISFIKEMYVRIKFKIYTLFNCKKRKTI